MFNLEKAIKQWESNLRKNPSFEDGDIAELESHLRDRIQQLKAKGITQQKAFQNATDELGALETLGDELYKTKTIRPDATPYWKQQGWIPSLLPNYLKTSTRNLFRRKGYALLNIMGLAFGMAAVLLITQYVYNEFSYDSFHEKSDRIYRISLGSYQNGSLAWRSATSYPAIGPTMKDRFPQVESYARLYHGEGILSVADLKGKETLFREEHGYYADASVFDVFSFRFISGDPGSALSRPQSIVISKSLAEKYFGNRDPMGETLLLDQEAVFTITGVFDNYPENSHLTIDYLLSYSSLVSREGEEANTSWGWYSFYTYVLLEKEADPLELETKLPMMLRDYKADFYEGANVREELRLQPLRDIYLYSQLNEEAGVNGNGSVLKYLLFIGVIILVVAWVNYVNISTARSLDRAKEVGIRKVSGAYQYQLIWQFLSEAFIMNVISCLVAFLIAWISFPLLQNLTGESLSLGLFATAEFWLALTAILIVGTVISGLYPSFFLSSFRPVTVLKGKLSRSTKGITLRRGLVVFQFTVSFILIVGTITIYRQVDYMRSRELGINLEQTLVVLGPQAIGDEVVYASRLETLKDELSQASGVRGVTTSSYVPGAEIRWTNGMKRAERIDAVRNTVYISAIDYDYLNEYEIELLAGRNFSSDYPSDSEAILINQTAASLFGFQNYDEAVGHLLATGEDTLSIVGVFEDYYQTGLRNELSPMVFLLQPEDARYLSLKITGDNIPGTLDDIEQTYEAMFPGSPFEYFFLDRFFDQLYKSDQQFRSIFTAFSLLAILIASLGLFGLASLVVSNRTKEIGIRKILGAGMLRITGTLTLEFWKLILISIAIAVPVSHSLVLAWLQSYPNRVEVGAGTFILAVFFIVVITAFTIGYQTLRAAHMNPVKSLKSE